jgi:hypothetical protein
MSWFDITDAASAQYGFDKRRGYESNSFLALDYAADSTIKPAMRGSILELSDLAIYRSINFSCPKEADVIGRFQEG